MLATLGGFLALVLGLTILLLPLLVTELSRPRDSVWGAVVLLLGLVLVTSADRLTGAPMLAVLCGGLLIGRLGSEVAQGRWRVLSDEERAALLSSERWSRSLSQVGASAASLLETVAGLVSGLLSWQAQRSQGRSKGKRWVRAEAAEPSVQAAEMPSPQPESPSGDEQTAEPDASGGGDVPAQDSDVPVVSDFSGIDALLEAAEPAAGPDAEASPNQPLPRLASSSPQPDGQASTA